MSEIRLDADFNAAVAEALKFAESIIKIEKSGDQVAKKSREQAAEERRLAQVRKQLLDETLSGSERARKAIEDFNKSIRGQAVDEQKVAQVRAKLAAEYVAAKNEESGATGRAAQAEKDRTDKLKEQADEERKLAANRDRYFSQYQSNADRVRAKIEDFNRSLKGVKGREEEIAQVRRKMHAEYVAALAKDNEGLIEFHEELEEVQEAGSDAFDAGKLLRFGAGFLSVQSLVSQVLAVIKGVREETDRLGDNLSNLTQSSGNLTQLAGADAALRDKLFAASDEAYAFGLLKTREEADKLIFELQSGGRLGELDFFKRVSAVDDAVGIAKNVGVIDAGFRGGDAVGSAADIFSKAIAAANPAVGVDTSEIVNAVAEVAAIAKEFGLRDEEVFGAISRIAEQTGNADTAATNFRQLLISSQRRGLADELKGQGLGAIIERVAQEGKTGKGLVDFLGDTQGILGFKQLQNVAANNKRIAEIDAAARSGVAEQTILNALGSDRVRAGQYRQRNENLAVLARDQESTAELYADAENRRDIEKARAEYGNWYAYGRESLVSFGRLFGQEGMAERGKAQSDADFAAEQAAANERIRANAAAQANNPEELFYAQQRRQQSLESTAYAARERAEEAAKESEKQAKKDEAAHNKAERAERKIEAAARREENAAERARREALAETRDQSELSRVMRETGELAKRNGVAFDGETAIDKYREKRPGEAAGMTDTEILREIAKGIREQGAEAKKQTDLLRKRTGTRTR